MIWNRSIMILAGTVLSGALLVAAPEPTAPTNEIVELLKDLRPPHQLARCKDLLSPPTEKTLMTPAGKEVELKQAMETIERAKAIVPALRKLIKPGTSVFDYPGLLARSTISYDELERKYEGYVGVYLLPHEGREPYDFRVVFDAKGLILEVQDVVHKQ